MRVKILGTRGEIKIRNPLHDNHSGILIDKTILCNIGEKKYTDTIQNLSLLLIFIPIMLFLFLKMKQSI